MNRSFTWLLLCISGSAVAQDTSSIPAQKLVGEDRLDDELRHVDPSIEGWNTEVLSAQAQGQIEELVRTSLDSVPPRPDSLPAFVSEGVKSSALCPATLTALRQSPALNIARGSIPGEMRSGRAALAQALGGLRKLHDAGGESHIKVKIVRVAAEASGLITTQGLFRLWTEAPSGITQSDAIWTCQWQPSSDGLELLSVRAEAYTQSSSPGPMFADCSAAVLGGNRAWSEQLGRGTDDWCGQIERGAGMDQYGHSGLAVGDFNGDGLEDLYLCQPGGLPNRLFVQNADGTATDRSAEFGVDWIDNTKSALLCDLDGDRESELVLTLDTGLIITSRGEQGRFEVETVLPVGGAYTLAAADYDGDGLVDLYVCNYATSEKKAGLPTPYHDANNGPPNYIFRNLGKLAFEDVTAKVGLDANNTRFSFAASWADYDNDGDPDLYVANDFGRNSLYRNDDGRFTDVAASAGVEDISAGMGVSWADYDGDGLLDVYVSNMFSSAGQRIAYQRRFKASARAETRQGFQRHARGNSLFRNLGDGTFADVTVGANVWMGRWSWGADFTDFDNDGHPDLFVPNGFITNEQNTDL